MNNKFKYLINNFIPILAIFWGILIILNWIIYSEIKGNDVLASVATFMMGVAIYNLIKNKKR